MATNLIPAGGCRQDAYVGKLVPIDFALACCDVDPTFLNYFPIGAQQGGDISLDWDTVDGTHSGSAGSTRASYATFQSVTISGDGLCLVKDGQLSNQTFLWKHVTKPDGGQPTAWLRMTFPDITIYAYCVIKSMSRAITFDDLAKYTWEANSTASTHGIVIEDTPDMGEFTPSVLFQNGEQGLWFDPSDLATMFQDANGTTPVTAAGQPVGLILDKSQKLARGEETVTNGDFSAGITAWESSSAVLSVVGGACQAVATGVSGRAYQRVPAVAGKTYEVSVFCKSGTIAVRMGFGAASGTEYYLSPNIAAGTTFKFLYVPTDPMVYATIRVIGDSATAVFDNVSIKELKGNHAFQASAAGRPLLRQNLGLSYLEFDGVDDSLDTFNADLSASDKAGVYTAVRKLEDRTTYQFIMKSGDGTGSEPGAFSVSVSNFPSAAAGYTAQSGGTRAGANIRMEEAAPVTSVLSYMTDISAARRVFRVNGKQEIATDSLGAGNMANVPIHIGRRLSTSYFKGYIYGIVVRGTTLPEVFTYALEKYLSAKSGAKL